MTTTVIIISYYSDRSYIVDEPYLTRSWVMGNVM